MHAAQRFPGWLCSTAIWPHAWPAARQTASSLRRTAQPFTAGQTGFGQTEQAPVAASECACNAALHFAPFTHCLLTAPVGPQPRMRFLALLPPPVPTLTKRAPLQVLHNSLPQLPSFELSLPFATPARHASPAPPPSPCSSLLASPPYSHSRHFNMAFHLPGASVPSSERPFICWHLQALNQNAAAAVPEATELKRCFAAA